MGDDLFYFRYFHPFISPCSTALRGNTWFADRNITPWEKLHAVLILWWWRADVCEQKKSVSTVPRDHCIYEYTPRAIWKEQTTVKNRFESSVALSKWTSRWAHVGCESMLLIYLTVAAHDAMEHVTYLKYRNKSNYLRTCIYHTMINILWQCIIIHFLFIGFVGLIVFVVIVGFSHYTSAIFYNHGRSKEQTTR